MGLPRPVAAACQEISEDRKLDGERLTRRAVVALADLFEHWEQESVEALLDETRACAAALARARLAAPMLANAMGSLHAKIERVAPRSDEPGAAARQVVATFLGELERAVIEASRQVGRAVGPEKVILAASCTPTLVEGLCRGRAAKVIVAESRPGTDGRRAAARLAEAGLPVELVSDGAAPARARKASMVLIGASALLADGAAVGETGTFGVALAASYEEIPFDVVAERLKISPVHATPQERRPPEELWPDAPHGVEVVNLSHDLIPVSLIRRIITERGPIDHDEAAQIAARKRATWRAIGLM